MTGRLERVLVRPPLPEDAPRWREHGWRAAPDVAAAAAEHEAFCAILESAGVEVVLSQHDPGNPDAIYVYDPALVGGEGAVLLRPGKEARRRSLPSTSRSPDSWTSRLSPRAATPSGWTRARCSSESATGRTRLQYRL